jgi:hypothetical protein
MASVCQNKACDIRVHYQSSPHNNGFMGPTKLTLRHASKPGVFRNIMAVLRPPADCAALWLAFSLLPTAAFVSMFQSRLG